MDATSFRREQAKNADLTLVVGRGIHPKTEPSAGDDVRRVPPSKQDF